ncbi:MAG: hypothetical protein M3198_12610 [Actinomycetota bacterium]|nr:hypothetical protein [Actinomycetota bacterium]
MHQLVRWGARWMEEREAEETFRSEWLAVALAALSPRRRSGKVEIRAGETIVSVDRGRVSTGPVAEPDPVVEGSPEAVLGVAAGKIPLSALTVRGDKDVAAKALTPA